jgi:cellulose synthase/poly-beta-1,6-N-acetylglucosamine synthase-like glycosyltransferase
MLEAVLGCSLLATLGLGAMLAFHGRWIGRWPLFGVAAIAVATGSGMAAAQVAHQLGTTIRLTILLLVPLLILGAALRRIYWPHRLFLAGLILTSVVFLCALAGITFGGSLPPLGLGLSAALLALELLGIVLTVVFAYELADALGQKPWQPVIPPGAERYQPRVAIQVPAYNEPPELLRQTLEALARLDYPDYLVQVVVNNTTDPALWQPVEATCRELGPRFQFIHLPSWPGYKAGALNEATRRLPHDIELVAIVDADYVVRPDFLRACVPYLADPAVAFVQTPQHYREWADSAYLRGLFYAYRYFFDVTMVSRARVNAIIFGGTMGLIRTQALHDIGGWAEWCITEDAEASLRLLARGWKSVYLNQPLGEGLMPLDFAGLRRQRFRWAFGGVQILRRHLGLMVGRAPSRLTLIQRYHYLMGGLGWFGDAVSVGLGIFLLITAGFLTMGHPLLLRQLAGVLLVLPVFLLISGLIRLGWSLKVATGAPWRDVPAATMIMLALGWTVTLACVRAMIQQRGVFLRTPKVRMPSRIGRAIATTSLESAMAAIFLVMAPVVFVAGNRPLGLLISALLLWQGLAWGCAPVASLLSQDIASTALRRTFQMSPQNVGGRLREWTAQGSRLALAPALALAAFLLIPSLVVGGGDDSITQTFGLPPKQPAVASSAKPGSRSASTTGSAAASRPAPSPSASQRPGPHASASPTASATATPAPSPSHGPKPRATPTATPTPTPTP